MALYEISGTATGTGSSNAPGTLIFDIVSAVSGSATVSADTQGIINVSGFLRGEGSLIDARLLEVAGTSIGEGSISGDVTAYFSFAGFTVGSGQVVFSAPEPIYGVSVVTAYMDVVSVPLPLCEAPTVSLIFRWGHVFTVGDLTLAVKDRRGNPFGPVSVGYTLYQMQPGCALKQIGPSGRKPASSSLGCYYVTGTAGERGQPGLWAVKWCYQRTFNSPTIEETCYFQVADAISCPVSGDTLARTCKYGWD